MKKSKKRLFHSVRDDTEKPDISKPSAETSDTDGISENDETDKTIPTEKSALADDEHVLNLPHTKNFKLTEGYDYLRTSPLPTVAYKTARVAAHPILFCMHKAMLGIRVEGIENLDSIRKRGAVIISNHVHPLDCTVLDCILRRRRVYYTTLQSNFNIPFARYLIRLFGGVPIPTDIHLMKKFTAEMHRAIEHGDCVVIYPEGALHPYCKNIRSFKIGAFRLANAGGYPILPIVMSFRKPDGIYKLYKNKPCLTVKILPPIMPEASGMSPSSPANSRERDNALRTLCSDYMKEHI